ncbi:hypothetical protein EPUL_002856 [Erysiphe pulchra]|uniref:Uncharacterized protein n=1 Tax=Erysiphe pulchra TaxID=225359 RepID=A0A2S4PVB2_9PEZI|nr:hypothetical protein EPUL_002856 [Erysiphe pulchra]
MIDSMEISRESQAPLMESSHQPPPISPIHLSSPLIAPLSPPSNLDQPTKTIDGRQIRPPQSSGENCDIANSFLPQELAEIIAIRQHRERAWHIRILIRATMISSIDSTLANFTEELEIEEVEAFKAYLRQAIANFATTASRLYHIFHHIPI